MTNQITYQTAQTDQEFEEAKALFREYADSLDIDLSFQNFSKEFTHTREQYDQPTGALILVYVNHSLAGCIGVRKLDIETAELKRMYVKPAYRGLKLGKELLRQSLDAAHSLGYQKVRLDTLSSMLPALKLYESFGFERIPAYYVNPIENVVYMEKVL